MIKRFSEMLEQAKALKDVKIAVAMAESEEVLEAVEMAHKEGIADAILVGDEDKIKTIMTRLQMDPSHYEFRDVKDGPEAARVAVSLVRNGEAGILMKGLIDTSVILKAVLNKEEGLRSGSVLSHVALFEVPSYHKLLTVTDAAMNITPDVDTKEMIIGNALAVTGALGIEEAKVAVLAAKEKVNDKMEATLHAAELKKRQFKGAIVDGPFALDNAVSEESARIKGLNSPVAGDADILLAPQIDAGNILYKALSFLAQAKNAGIIVGAKKPIVLTSRADSEITRLYSIALAMVVADYLNKEA